MKKKILNELNETINKLDNLLENKDENTINLVLTGNGSKDATALNTAIKAKKIVNICDKTGHHQSTAFMYKNKYYLTDEVYTNAIKLINNKDTDFLDNAIIFNTLKEFEDFNKGD